LATKGSFCPGEARGGLPEEGAVVGEGKGGFLYVRRGEIASQSPGL